MTDHQSQNHPDKTESSSFYKVEEFEKDRPQSAAAVMLIKDEISEVKKKVASFEPRAKDNLFAALTSIQKARDDSSSKYKRLKTVEESPYYVE